MTKIHQNPRKPTKQYEIRTKPNETKPNTIKLNTHKNTKIRRKNIPVESNIAETRKKLEKPQNTHENPRKTHKKNKINPKKTENPRKPHQIYEYYQNQKTQHEKTRNTTKYLRKTNPKSQNKHETATKKHGRPTKNTKTHEKPARNHDKLTKTHETFMKTHENHVKPPKNSRKSTKKKQNPWKNTKYQKGFPRCSTDPGYSFPICIILRCGAVHILVFEAPTVRCGVVLSKGKSYVAMPFGKKKLKNHTVSCPRRSEVLDFKDPKA